MTVRNPDGTPYHVTGSLQQFDPENPEHELFELWDQEAIKIGGSPIFYFEVFIQPQTIDPIYWEDRGKIWSPEPVQLYCTYEPVSAQNYMGLFGADSPDEVMFEFNYRAVLNTIQHPPRIGSRLFSPHKREHWEIIQREVGEWKMWGELRLKLHCRRFQDNKTSPAGLDTQKQPDFKLNEGALLKPNP